MTYEEVLREFAAFGVGVECFEDVSVWMRKSINPFPLPRSFDLESPAEMVAEETRLRRLAIARRSADVQEHPKRRNVIRRKRKRAIPEAASCGPCQICGNPTRWLYCGPACSCRAHEDRRAKEKGCRLKHCPHDKEPGKTYCRAHLDERASRARERRRQGKAV